MARALVLLWNESARVVDPQDYQTFSWEDWSTLRPQAGEAFVQAIRFRVRAPEVITLTEYDRLPSAAVTFSRRNIFKRDRYVCQYCGGQPGSKELRFDHVVPRAQGGESRWENCVLSCVDCNHRKADRTPEQAGLRLRKPPVRPVWKPPGTDAQRWSAAHDVRIESWSKFVSDTLAPGLYAFWRDTGDARVVEVDMRETMIDVGGQEIMTNDKVTLRLNAVVTYRIVGAHQAVTTTDDAQQTLYREAHLVLRAVVGARDLDALLTDKDAVIQEVEEMLRRHAGELGLEVVSVGIRDVILPGDMKDLMNKVTEAKKAAEANLISRREETAAMRSQAGTDRRVVAAKLLADNPTLMRLRELEVLERVACEGKLNVVLGEKGLADRVVNLL